MPVGKWKRFKLAFFNGRDDKAKAWTGIAERTLKMVRDAATALKDISEHEERADEILHRLKVLDKAVADAKKEYEEATENGPKDAAISKMNVANTEGETLLSEIQTKLRAKGAAAIMGLPGGKGVLDDMMSEIDWSADRDADETFGLAALKARFQIDTIEGKLGHVSLPKLYDILSKLPDDHTRTNDQLKKVKRETPLFKMGGLYSGREKAIVIVSKWSNGVMGSGHTSDADDEVADEEKPNPGSVKTFSHVVLHEIGHAYDHSVGFMGGKTGNASYGTWRPVGSEDVAEAWGAEKNFFSDTAFAGIPRSFLVTYLVKELEEGDKGEKAKLEWAKLVKKGNAAPNTTQVTQQTQVAAAITRYNQYQNDSDTENVWPEELSDREAESKVLTDALHTAIRTSTTLTTNDAKVAWSLCCNPAIKAILIDKVDPTTAIASAVSSVTVYTGVTPPWDTMKNHAAARVMREFKKAVGTGFWKGGATKAAQYAIGDVCYTIDSAGKLYTYALSARQYSVSKYQWHAPAEWFAELYAFYFAGRLKEDSTMVKLFLKDLGEPFVV